MAATLLPIMNAEQVAALLECSKKTVEDHARKGTIPGAKFGDGWVFSADLVIEAVKQQSINKTPVKLSQKTVGAVAVNFTPPSKGKSKPLPKLTAM